MHNGKEVINHSLIIVYRVCTLDNMQGLFESSVYNNAILQAMVWRIFQEQCLVKEMRHEDVSLGVARVIPA